MLSGKAIRICHFPQIDRSREVLYFEKWQKYPELRQFLATEDMLKFKDWFDSCVFNNDFVTLSYFVNEAPPHLFGHVSFIERSYFLWFHTM